jgi:hypothetical protein
MSSVAAACPRCQNALPGALCNTGALVECPSCDRSVQVEFFPALFKPVAAGAGAEAILEEGTSSCFYHEQKKAVVPCDVCGRFLCALCDLDFGGQHLCPQCVQTGRKKGSISELEHSRTLYDSAALSIVLINFIFLPMAVVSAPIAIYLAIRSWYRPGSLVRTSRVRSWVAIVVALAQLGFWIWMAINIALER